MDYSDLKSALSSLTGTFTWPTAPTASTYFYIVPPNTVAAQQPQAKISVLETALQTWLPGAPITALINGLPSELQSFVGKLLAEMSIGELGVTVGANQDGALAVNGFNAIFEIDFSTKPTIGGIELDTVALELNLVIIGDKLVWSPTLAATCTFLGISCSLAVGLFSPSIKIMLSETENTSIDTLLGSATSGTTLSGLQSTMGITATGDTPDIEMLLVTAELTSSPTFSCLAVIDAPDWTWKGCTLTEVGVSFQHGGGDTAFSFAATLTIGGIDVETLVSHDSATETTTVDGALSSQGAELSDFLGTMATELGFTNPLPSLSEFELSGVSFSITDKQSKINFQMACEGAVAFDATGTSLQFSFSFLYDEQSGDDVTVTLQLADLTFELEETSGTYVFSYTGPGSVSISHLVHMAQLYPLYSLAEDIELTLSKAVLAILPNQPSGHHILFALEFSLEATLDNDILKMIVGGDDIGLKAATIMAANQAWTPQDLATISGSPLPLSAPVQQGVSFSATLAIGDNQVSAPLAPPNTNNSTSSSSSQPSPKGVQSPNAAMWFNVQKQIGPVYMDRIGLKLDIHSADGVIIDILTDASFMLGPMTIAVEGFSINVPFANPSQFSVGLQGINVSYNKAPLSISGGFLDKGNSLFIGDLEVQTETLFLSAIGEYANSGGYTSLALFASLTDPPLGGPVFCFVTGLAAGGGYNSSLKIPTKAEQVVQFPLIEAASSAGPIANPFTVIENCIQPEQGEDWIAVGLNFRSFELVQSTALLTATFGDKFQFAILGQSEMSVPPASDTRIAYAQVDIEARYIPSEKALSVAGILTPNSYVLSKDCHIQGGFVYILQESGDFVVSYGGYATDFDYASRGYPAVPRLEMIWNIDSHTNIKGSEYFALTPAAMMAGGGLQATWNCGIFSAWFDVAVNVLIQWRPFYYQIGFSMSLGVSFDLKILFVHIHFTFHIGAQLAIAGPPFHGHAHIDLSVISFDVNFGPSAAQPDALLWPDFRQMLPGDPSKDATQSGLLCVKVTQGLKKNLSQSSTHQQTLNGGIENAIESTRESTIANTTENTPQEPQPDWVVNGTHFSFNIQSSLPITETSTGQVTVTEAPQAATIGILPMEKASAQGTLDIVITGPDGLLLTASTEPTAKVVVAPIETDMAPAQWGTEKPQNSNITPVNCTSGYIISGGIPTPEQTSPVDLSLLLADTVTITAISNRTASATPFAT